MGPGMENTLEPAFERFCKGQPVCLLETGGGKLPGKDHLAASSADCGNSA